MKKILVTGASGYVGSVLVRLLLEENFQVIAIDRFFFGDRLPEHKNLKKIKADSRTLDPDLFKGVATVIDLVALSNDPSGELFQDITYEINHKSRARTAKLAKEHGVSQYILPSSCSIYGFQDHQVNELSPTNALTTYAIANEKAEQDVLTLSDKTFCVTVLRQATLFGYSPRMRFDLAINGMTLSVFKHGYLPLMRDGKQIRPMLHVKDTSDLMCKLINTDHSIINNEIFNVGGNRQNYPLAELAQSVCKIAKELIGKEVPINWYGDPDKRSYDVSFDKIQNILNWEPQYDVAFGVREILGKLKSSELEDSPDTITLDWYQQLIKWHKIIKDTELSDHILHLPEQAQ